MTKLRADDRIQRLFRGVIPDRRRNLKRLMRKYRPRFFIVDEITDGTRFVMQAGRFFDVEFNHRAIRIFWLGAYAAWEAYSAAHRAYSDKGLDRSLFDGQRLALLLDAIDRMIAVDDSTTVPMPAGVPEPGYYPDRETASEALAPAELATFATGWALLHEVRHLIHQQKGTGTMLYVLSPLQQAEEFSCDAYATAYLLTKVHGHYSRRGDIAGRVLNKRQMGIIFGFVALATIVGDSSKASQSHPALQDRLDVAIEQMGLTAERSAIVVGYLALLGLRELRPLAPSIDLGSFVTR